MTSGGEDKTNRITADNAWEQATKQFANVKAMRWRSSWLTGVSMDTASDRIQRLLRQPHAKSLYEILDGLDAAELRSFLQRADINLDRAAAALRLNMIVNISLPVGALVIVNQLFPQAVSSFIAAYGMDSIIIGAICVVFLVLLSIWYSYCAVTQARDLAHLTRLYAVRQFDPAGARLDFDDEPLNPAELA